MWSRISPTFCAAITVAAVLVCQFGISSAELVIALPDQSPIAMQQQQQNLKYPDTPQDFYHKYPEKFHTESAESSQASESASASEHRDQREHGSPSASSSRNQNQYTKISASIAKANDNDPLTINLKLSPASLRLLSQAVEEQKHQQSEKFSATSGSGFGRNQQPYRFLSSPPDPDFTGNRQSRPSGTGNRYGNENEFDRPSKQSSSSSSSYGSSNQYKNYKPNYGADDGYGGGGDDDYKYTAYDDKDSYNNVGNNGFRPGPGSYVVRKTPSRNMFQNIASTVVNSVRRIPSNVDLMFADMGKMYRKSVYRMVNLMPGSRSNRPPPRPAPGVSWDDDFSSSSYRQTTREN